jgi:Tfp pilus assembly protein PilO
MDLQKIILKLKGMPAKVLFPVLGGGLFLFVALDVFLVIRPQVNSISALNSRMTELATNISDLKSNSGRMKQFQASLEDARTQMARFKAMVHQPDGVAGVVQKVSTTANEYGVKIDQVVPQRSDGVILVTNDDGKYTSLSILVRARAGYHELGRFIRRLEKESVYWQFDAVDITADQADPARHAVKLQMKILILGK